MTIHRSVVKLSSVSVYHKVQKWTQTNIKVTFHPTTPHPPPNRKLFYLVGIDYAPIKRYHQFFLWLYRTGCQKVLGYQQAYSFPKYGTFWYLVNFYQKVGLNFLLKHQDVKFQNTALSRTLAAFFLIFVIKSSIF